MGCACAKQKEKPNEYQVKRKKYRKTTGGVAIGSNQQNQGEIQNAYTAAEQRQQQFQKRGMNQASLLEMKYKQKQLEEAERLQREKQGNYKLYYKNT